MPVTPGDPTVPKSTGRPRTGRGATPKTATQAKKAASKSAGTSAAGTRGREPRVSASKAGVAQKRVSGDAESPEEVLERLAKLEPAEVAVDDASESITLPTIVEADPTYPPLAVPAAARTAGDAIGPVSVREEPDSTDVSETPDGSGDPRMTMVLVRPADGSSTSVSEDLPTALVPQESDVVELAPDRTDVVPAVPVVPTHDPIGPVTPVELGEEFAPTVFVDESTGVVLPKRPLRAPMVFRRAKPRVRRVTRVVRHVDTWSVFKVALVFNVILYLVCLTSGVLLWNVAHATGTIDNIEKFFEQFGWESFEFKGGEIYHNAWIGGLFVAVGLTGFAVLIATLFNLITDLVGGIRVSVLEEEVVAKPRRSGSTESPDSTQGTARPSQ